MTYPPKHTMDIKDTDAHTDSSTVNDSTASSVQEAPEVSSASNDVAVADSSPQADELSEFKATVAKVVGGEADKSKPGTETEVSEQKDEPVADEGDKTEKDALLHSEQEKVTAKYTERPEWHKLTAIADKVGKAEGKEVRATLRELYQHQDALQQQVEKSKPALEVVQEMFQSVGNSEQGFNNMRTLIKNFEADPANAVPMLEVLIQDAKKRAGLVVSDTQLASEEQKLQEKLNDGLITEEEAEQRRQELLEVQQARLSKSQAEQREQAERQRREQAARKAAETELEQIEARWVSEKQKSDPDYTALESLHGAFIQKNAIKFHNDNGRLPNTTEAISLLEKSYKEAKAEALKFKPAPKERKVVKSNQGSSLDNRHAPSSEYEEFQMEVQKAVKRRL